MSLNRDQYYTAGRSFVSQGNKNMLNAIERNAYKPTRKLKGQSNSFVNTDIQNLKCGGKVHKMKDGGDYFKTRLSKEEEEKFQSYFNTLPANLQTDDNTYDIRGYWDAEGRPNEFDYSQPKEDDGYYHAYTRHPRTGKILKSPAHPTFAPSMEHETAKRVDVYGNVYTGLPEMVGGGEIMELTDKEIQKLRKGGYIVVEQ